jgi:hypothetical protein
MVGYEDEEEYVNICSITGVICEDHPPELAKLARKVYGGKLDSSTGILLSHRILNLPPSLAPKIYQSLSLPKSITRIIMISKAIRDKSLKKETHEQDY